MDLRSTLQPGLVVADYTLTKFLGEGTFGIVWKVEKEGDTYAIKFFKAGFDTSIITREYELMEQLDHPNVIQEFGLFQWESVTYLVMEYIQGNSMADFIAKSPKVAAKVKLSERFSPADYELILRGAVEGLLHAHTRPSPIIHRDLKPANIFILEDKGVKILDFGSSGPIDYNVKEKVLAGSYFYMAPAQLMGTANLQNDIWGFGVSLYQFLTGQHPYAFSAPSKKKTEQIQAANEEDLLRSLLKQMSAKMLMLEVEAPNHINPQIPPKLSYILLKCLRKNVRDRYSNFQEILDDLNNDPTAELVKEFGSTKNLARKTQRIAQIVSWNLRVVLFLLFFTVVFGLADVTGLFATSFLLLFLVAIVPTLLMQKAKAYQVYKDSKLAFNMNLISSKEAYAKMIKALIPNRLWQKNAKSEAYAERTPDKYFDERLLFHLNKGGKQKLADKIAKKILKENPNNISALSFLMSLAHERKDLKQTQQLFERVNSIDPGGIAHFFYLQHTLPQKPAVAPPLPEVDPLAATLQAPEAPSSLAATLKAPAPALAATIKAEDTDFAPASQQNSAASLSPFAKKVFEEGKATLALKGDQKELIVYSNNSFDLGKRTLIYSDIKISKSGNSIFAESEKALWGLLGGDKQWETLAFRSDLARQQWKSFFPHKVDQENIIPLIACTIVKTGLDHSTDDIRFILDEQGIKTDGDVYKYTRSNDASVSALYEAWKNRNDDQERAFLIDFDMLESLALGGLMLKVKGNPWETLSFIDEEERQDWYNYLMAHQQNWSPFEDTKFEEAFSIDKYQDQLAHAKVKLAEIQSKKIPQAPSLPSAQTPEALKEYQREVTIYKSRKKEHAEEIANQEYKLERQAKNLENKTLFLPVFKCLLQHGMESISSTPLVDLVETKIFTFDNNRQELRFQEEIWPFDTITAVNFQETKLSLQNKEGKDISVSYDVEQRDYLEYVPAFCSSLLHKIVVT